MPPGTPMRATSLLLALHLAACAVTPPAGPDDADDASETDGAPDPQDDPTAPCRVLDCADPECADRFECTWPDRVRITSEVAFTGRRIECAFGPTTIPFTVPDCGTRFEGRLLLLPDTDGCDACDRAYRGALTYAEDTCSELVGTDAPAEGTWGFRFVSPTERELFVRTADGAWQEGGSMTADAQGRFLSTATEELWQDPEDCGNGEQHLGDLTLTAMFRDVP